MDIKTAIKALAALAQETRLRAFKMLVEAGPKGLSAGVMSERLGVPQNTLSFHLSHLNNAGITQSRKEGRSIIYSAHFQFTRELIRFMVENCCQADTVSCHVDAQGAKEIIEFFIEKECCG
ncbi:ArsR/SmtB family transcription factor [Nitrosococcus wardiae]|uniref:ArsR family transcriptional regulator n=1 Tax=Nitrosococcus wardiae TaxID=1814290 RepID=A0A4P7C2H4_9GAMM|nr:metalloregulator ArsR/SmtB family transcription factor [Nitrosococcus wardiae]QBQ55046.1 ArsR family transcriptional regulator [Nitrosococcus wardiae]